MGAFQDFFDFRFLSNQLFNYSVIQLFSYSVIQLFNYSVIQLNSKHLSHKKHNRTASDNNSPIG